MHVQPSFTSVSLMASAAEGVHVPHGKYQRVDVPHTSALEFCVLPLPSPGKRTSVKALADVEDLRGRHVTVSCTLACAPSAPALEPRCRLAGNNQERLAAAEA